MSITATVENDTIKLPDGVHLPDGTKVIVELSDDQNPTLAERLAQFVGVAGGLPKDLAANHDHYLHGTPKRNP